ncbi:MAG: hypothetical protein KF861_22555 [Planctomycetaceae bacterium]|nr:hypothetical protein [Planctomycetaceae bacterium]
MMGGTTYAISGLQTFPYRALAAVGAGWCWMRLVFVGAVSAYDTYLTYVFRDVILSTEENPMGLWLIRLDPHGLVYFTTAKTVGTIAVLSLMAAAAPMCGPLRVGQFSAPRGTRTTHLWIRMRVQLNVWGDQLNYILHRRRETIVSGLASFQLWLLWYLCFYD